MFGEGCRIVHHGASRTPRGTGRPRPNHVHFVFVVFVFHTPFFELMDLGMEVPLAGGRWRPQRG